MKQEYIKQVISEYERSDDDSTVESDTSSASEYKSRDLTVAVVGEFGRWQFCISTLMSLLRLPMAWYQLNIIFMSPPQDFWCKKPESFQSLSNDEWRRISAPTVEEHPCLIFDPEVIFKNPTIDKRLVNLVLCPKFEYDTSVFNRTITSDWDLVCSKHWLAHFTQCVMMWGVLIGSIFFGALADKYGRKPILMYAIIIQCVASFIASVMQNYWYFLFVWFLLALASGGCGIISFVICMEVVSGKWRTVVPVYYQLPFGFGNAIMAGLAYWLRDWRKLEVVLAMLSSLYILYWFTIPESPRWLLATGRQNEALEVLKQGARKNKREYKYENIAHLLTTNRVEPVMLGCLDFLKSKNMRLKTILLSLNWFCIGLAFFTFSQYLGSLGPNIFLTVAFSGLISTPGYILCLLLITRTGRKLTVYTFEIFTAICFIFLLIIPKNVFANDWPRLLFAGLGFVGMAGTVPALYLLTGELYPTLGRNVGVGGVSTFARFGSMVAPAVVNLEYICDGLPLILLAAVSLGQIFLLVPLPETRNCPLPDTLEEAENFTK